MRVTVVDLELDGQDIIQIGAVRLDTKPCNESAVPLFRGDPQTTFQDNRIYNQFVCLPYGNLERKIVDLTGITDDILNSQGIDIFEAMNGPNSFWKWNEGRDVYAWGKDYETLLNALHTVGIPSGDGPKMPHKGVDLSALGQLLRSAYPSSKGRGGLRSTMDLFNVGFVGRQHNALIDAWNTAVLAQTWIERLKAFETIRTVVGR